MLNNNEISAADSLLSLGRHPAVASSKVTQKRPRDDTATPILETRAMKRLVFAPTIGANNMMAVVSPFGLCSFAYAQNSGRLHAAGNPGYLRFDNHYSRSQRGGSIFGNVEANFVSRNHAFQSAPFFKPLGDPNSPSVTSLQATELEVSSREGIPKWSRGEKRERPASVVSEASADSESKTGENGVELVPTPEDVLIGTGRTCSSHVGNKRFHREIYKSCDEYFKADYKKGVVDRIITSVEARGGRFLTKASNEWVVVSDKDRLERNTRKSFHMAKKQKARDVKALSQHSAASDESACSVMKPGVQVAVYMNDNFRMGTIEKEDSDGKRFVRFLNKESMWLDFDSADVRILSR